MLIKLTLLLLSFVSLLFGAPSGVYLEAGIALSDKQTLSSSNASYNFDKANISSFSLGYQDDVYRYEVQERYVAYDLSSAAVGSSNIATTGKLMYDSQLVNFYYSGYNKSNLVSSVGLGGGITSIDLKGDIKDKNILTAQGMFSLGYMSGEHFLTTFKYTYFYIKGSEHFSNDGSNVFTLSLRYIF